MTEKIVSLDTFWGHETPMIAKPSPLIDDFGNVLKQVKRHLQLMKEYSTSGFHANSFNC